MEQGNQIDFVVDEQYENEKGIYTVLSIHRNEMVIRWESGEEMRTNIELQRNILARREWEKIQMEKDAALAKAGKKSGAAKAAAAFEGFKESDFKNSASGTKWRGRGQLGGAVTHKLSQGKLKINSWAFANKPEMHWLDTRHHKRQSGDNRAKLFVRLDQTSMTFGFSIGQPKDDNETTKNWSNLMQWLMYDENEQTLHAIALTNDMTVVDRHGKDNFGLTPIKKGWQAGAGKKSQTFGKLKDYLDTLPTDVHLNLEMVKAVEKDKVLDSGKTIADDIASLFSQLVPLYKAALTALI